MTPIFNLVLIAAFISTSTRGQRLNSLFGDLIKGFNLKSPTVILGREHDLEDLCQTDWFLCLQPMGRNDETEIAGTRSKKSSESLMIAICLANSACFVVRKSRTYLRGPVEFTNRAFEHAVQITRPRCCLFRRGRACRSPRVQVGTCHVQVAMSSVSA